MFLLFLGVILVGLSAILTIYVWIRANNGPTTVIARSEMKYFDPNSKSYKDFEEPFEKHDDIYLSLVIPAYKEEKRLPVMLDETLPYLKSRSSKDKSFTWEIVIVDDGSNDKTAEVALDYVKNEGSDRVRLLKLDKNVGKGGAVRRGMFASRGSYRLMVDADGATKFSDLEKLEESMKKVEKNQHGVSLGSRSHLEDNVTQKQKRNFFRNLLMWGFHFCVEFLGGVRGIHDTQCGFKLFTRETTQVLFGNLHVERWCFDVELLYLASLFSIPLIEVPVNWTEIEGSKLEPLDASVQMFKDLLRIRLCYMFGVWKVKSNKND